MEEWARRWEASWWRGRGELGAKVEYEGRRVPTWKSSREDVAGRGWRRCVVEGLERRAFEYIRGLYTFGGDLKLSVLCCGIHGVCGFPDALANSRPAALVVPPAALAPCVCRRPCTILAALVAAFSSRCRRPCPLLAALAAFAAAFYPVCRRRPRELSPRRPCSYTSRPRTVCLSPSAAPCRRSDEATFHRSLSPEASSAPTPPSCLALRRVVVCEATFRQSPKSEHYGDSLVMPSLPSTPNDIGNQDHYRIYTRNHGYEESTTAV